MIRKSLFATLFLAIAWLGMVFLSGAQEAAHNVGRPVSPLNLGSLVVLGVGLAFAIGAYSFFAARGAFGVEKQVGERFAIRPTSRPVSQHS